MQGQSQQQAYDRGITIFSPDGRPYQVEYGPRGGETRHHERRGPGGGGEGVVLAVDKRIRSGLMEETSVEKIHKADDHVGIASTGHVADAHRLIDFARRRS
jgi:proteasome alpha subunit